MEPIIRAILDRDVESVKKLLGANLSFFMRKDHEENAAIIYCHEELVGNYSDEYMKNFKTQRKQFLELLDVDERNKTKSEQRQIGLDFLRFSCKFVQERILNFLIRFRINHPSGDKWHLIETLKDFKAGKEDIYNFLLNGGIGAVEINRLHLVHRYVRGDNAAEKMVKRFLQLGADINCLDHLGRSVLNNCAVLYRLSRSTIEIVKLLLKHGANPNLGRDCTLAAAAAWGNQEFTELLLEHGANANGRPGETTPLASAASRCRVDIVELLLERGAERDNYALLAAVQCTTDNIRYIDSNERRKMVKLLLDRGFDANYATAWRTVLCEAIKLEQEDIVKLLLEQGAQVDKIAEYGQCPLYYAAEKRNVEIIRLLLEYGTDSTVGLTLTRMRGNNLYAKAKFFVRELALLEAQNLYVSNEDLNEAQVDKELVKYYVNCKDELKILKLDKFDDSTLSSFDYLTIKDSHRLASLASNENIAKVIKRENFKEKFPIYGEEIVEKFDRGIAIKKDFDLFKRLVNYLSTRDHDQLPKLPFTFVTELFTYLNNEDFVTLRKL